MAEDLLSQLAVKHSISKESIQSDPKANAGTDVSPQSHRATSVPLTEEDDDIHKPPPRSGRLRNARHSIDDPLHLMGHMSILLANASNPDRKPSLLTSLKGITKKKKVGGGRVRHSPSESNLSMSPAPPESPLLNRDTSLQNIVLCRRISTDNAPAAMAALPEVSCKTCGDATSDTPIDTVPERGHACQPRDTSLSRRRHSSLSPVSLLASKPQGAEVSHAICFPSGAARRRSSAMCKGSPHLPKRPHCTCNFQYADSAQSKLASHGASQRDSGVFDSRESLTKRESMTSADSILEYTTPQTRRCIVCGGKLPPQGRRRSSETAAVLYTSSSGKKPDRRMRLSLSEQVPEDNAEMPATLESTPSDDRRILMRTRTGTGGDRQRPLIDKDSGFTSSVGSTASMSALPASRGEFSAAGGRRPSASIPSAGTPSAGTPSAGTPSAGTPSAGTPSAGTPSASTEAPKKSTYRSMSHKLSRRVKRMASQGGSFEALNFCLPDAPRSPKTGMPKRNSESALCLSRQKSAVMNVPSRHPVHRASLISEETGDGFGHDALPASKLSSSASCDTSHLSSETGERLHGAPHSSAMLSMSAPGDPSLLWESDCNRAHSPQWLSSNSLDQSCASPGTSAHHLDNNPAACHSYQWRCSDSVASSLNGSSEMLADSRPVCSNSRLPLTPVRLIKLTRSVSLSSEGDSESTTEPSIRLKKKKKKRESLPLIQVARSMTSLRSENGSPVVASLRRKSEDFSSASLGLVPSEGRISLSSLFSTSSGDEPSMDISNSSQGSGHSLLRRTSSSQESLGSDRATVSKSASHYRLPVENRENYAFPIVRIARSLTDISSAVDSSSSIGGQSCNSVTSAPFMQDEVAAEACILDRRNLSLANINGDGSMDKASFLRRRFGGSPSSTRSDISSSVRVRKRVRSPHTAVIRVLSATDTPSRSLLSSSPSHKVSQDTEDSGIGARRAMMRGASKGLKNLATFTHKRVSSREKKPKLNIDEILKNSYKYTATIDTTELDDIRLYGALDSEDEDTQLDKRLEPAKQSFLASSARRAAVLALLPAASLFSLPSDISNTCTDESDDDLGGTRLAPKRSSLRPTTGMLMDSNSNCNLLQPIDSCNSDDDDNRDGDHDDDDDDAKEEDHDCYLALIEVEPRRPGNNDIISTC